MKFPHKAESGSGSGGEKYLKLKSGESITGIFRGEIHEHFVRWNNGKSEAAQLGEPGAKIRFEINFVTFVDGRFIAKIFSFPQSLYNQLADVNSEYPLEKTKVKLSRSGDGLETEWRVLPLVSEKDKLTAQILQQIEQVTLNILDRPKVQNASIAPENVPWPNSDDIEEIPF